jgi:hypothetical protein
MKPETACRIVELYAPTIARQTDPRFHMELAETVAANLNIDIPALEAERFGTTDDN